MKFVKKYQKAILGALIIGLFVGYFLLNRQDFTALHNIKPGYLLLVGLGYLVIIITNGIIMKLLARPFGANLKTHESVRVALLGSIGNFFASSGAGVGVRAVYLKKNYNLNYKDYLSTQYGNYLLIFIVNSVAGILSLIFTNSKGGVLFWLAMLFFCLLLVISTILCFVPLKLRVGHRSISKISKLLNTMTQGWQLVAGNKTVFNKLLAVTATQLLVTLCIIYLQVQSLGLTVNFSGLLFLAVLTALSVFVSLTPANIGVKEAVYLLSTSIVGLSSGDILSIAVIDRGVLFTVLGILWILIGRKKSRVNVHA